MPTRFHANRFRFLFYLLFSKSFRCIKLLKLNALISLCLKCMGLQTAFAIQKHVAVNQNQGSGFFLLQSYWHKLVMFTGGIVPAALLLVLVIIAVLMIILALKYWSRQTSRKKSLRSSEVKAGVSDKFSSTTGEKIKNDKILSEELPLQQQIQLFFFNLFKIQSGIDKDTPGQMYKVETRERCPENVFLMRIKPSGDWLVRRMSIGLLSAGAGSRSQCFYVIYDTHLVVKVPPQSITEFYQYNKQIAREALVAEQLSPIPCIVPRVSVILRKVYNLPYMDELSQDEVEKRYKNLVETRPEYQEYLKIGNSFVFFMELSKHFFLSRTIEDIHSDRSTVEEEIVSHGELVWDQNGFTGRYGEDYWHLGIQTAKIFNEIEDRLRKWCANYGVADVCSQYQLRRWFISFLSKYGHKSEKTESSEETLDQRVVQYVGRLVEDHSSDLLAFRKMVEAYLVNSRYEKTRTWRRNLSSAMLDMLARLAEKKVAMRDLKPENLFVAGDPARYPNFLNDINGFSMGLIDMETAAIMKQENGEPVEQPQLGGTPLYATPSHFLPNKALALIFKDVRQTLHLQDWFAVMAIIYKIIVGNTLFVKTAGLFSDMLRKLRAKKKAQEKLQVMMEQSSLFWSSAVQEFETSLITHIDVLDSIRIKVPKPMLNEIKQELTRRVVKLEERVNNLLQRQAIFKHPHQKKQIQEGTSTFIEQSKMRLLARKHNDSKQNSALDDAVKFLEQIRILKFRIETNQMAISDLDSQPAEISSIALLEAMFYNVMNFMYPRQWSRYTGDTVSIKDDQNQETTFLPTV